MLASAVAVGPALCVGSGWYTIVGSVRGGGAGSGPGAGGEPPHWQ